MATSRKLGTQVAVGARKAGVGCLCGCHPSKVREEGRGGDCPPAELKGGSGRPNRVAGVGAAERGWVTTQDIVEDRRAVACASRPLVRGGRPPGHRAESSVPSTALRDRALGGPQNTNSLKLIISKT